MMVILKREVAGEQIKARLYCGGSDWEVNGKDNKLFY